MTGPNWNLEADYETVTLTFPTNPRVALKLKTADIEDMLKNLGDFRAAMKPEIPRSYSIGQIFVAIPDPAWVTEPELMGGNSVLHVRDPRFGWQHYMIPREEARKLAQFLQVQVDSPPPAAKPEEVN